MIILIMMFVILRMIIMVHLCLFLLGTFGEVELASFGILFQWASFVFMVRSFFFLFFQIHEHTLQSFHLEEFCMSYCISSGRSCRDGRVVRALASHQCGPGSIPRSGVICELSLLVLYSAPRGFLRVIRFFLSSKTSI